MKWFYLSARVKLGLALVGSSLASMGLYVAGAWSNHDGAFGYLPWNLLLAWLALIVALWLVCLVCYRALAGFSAEYVLHDK